MFTLSGRQSKQSVDRQIKHYFGYQKIVNLIHKCRNLSIVIILEIQNDYFKCRE